MENRTGFRRPSLRGPAARAAQARLALGLAPRVEVDLSGTDLPIPLIHAAAGVAACAIATLVRPEALGVVLSAICTVILAGGMGVGLIAYDRLVFPTELRPPRASIALPVAAVIAYVVVLGATDSVALRIVAAVTAAASVGAIPFFEGQALKGRVTPLSRLLRDGLGVLLLLPCLVAAVSLDEALATRMAIAVGATWLITIDGLRMEKVERAFALKAATAVSVLTAVAALIANGGSPGLRAGLVLVVWYGLRGAALTFSVGRRGKALILEYIAVVAVATTLLLVTHV